MRNKHRNLLSVALVLLCIALLAGTAVLLLRTLPKKQPGTVDTIQTGAVFDQTDNTAAPDREQAYDGELPNLSDTLEPDEAETPAPEDEAALAAAKLAEQTLASMTLDEKLWQLFFVTPEAITKVETATLAGEATKAAIESQPVGGLVYFAKNLENRAQTVTLLENSQSYSKIPLFLGVDEEGGTVSRLKTSGLAIDTGVGTMQSIGETRRPCRGLCRRAGDRRATCTRSASISILRRSPTYRPAKMPRSAPARSAQTRNFAPRWPGLSRTR